MATKESMAEVHSVMILLNNLRLLLAAHDMRSGLREQISWFCEQLEVMFGFLLVYCPSSDQEMSGLSEKISSSCEVMLGLLLEYYSEDGSNSDHHHHHLAAGPSSDQEMSGLSEKISSFCEVMLGLLLEYYSEDGSNSDHHHHLAAGPSSDQEMSWLSEKISSFCEVVLGLLLEYYSEDGSNSDHHYHHLAAGPSSDQEMSGLSEKISSFCEVMLGLLLEYYSEDGSNSDHHHHLAAGPSSDQEMHKVVEMIRDFAVESGDVVLDAFEIMAKQHTHSTNNTTTADEDDESLQLALYDNPAAALGVEVREIVSLIHAYNSDEYYRNVCKKNAEKSMRVYPSKRSHQTLDAADFAGLEFNLRVMLQRLIEPNGTRQLSVIAITGEGGTGKTTLAKLLYRGYRVQADCCGWMSVSKTYVLRDLMLSVLKDVMMSTENIHDMDDRELGNEIRNQLKGRRYLIVVDDVWDTQTWDKLKHLFPGGSNYSRILVTTRCPSVASHATRPDTKPFPLSQYFFDPLDSLPLGKESEKFFNSTGIRQCDCFELKPLNQDHSWMLFCRLYSNNQYYPGDQYYPGYHHEIEAHELEAQGRRIVRSCCGRPLVISVVAHILKAIDRVGGSSWSSIAAQINDEPLSRGDYDQQMDILTLCFHKLPQHLQSCFLYLGALFPEDTEIDLKQLIQLWVAEGLIGLPVQLVNNANGTMEDAAEYYLEELNGLRLIEVSRKRSDGRAKSCFIHDILRDFCLRLSKKEGFLEVHTGGDHTNTSSTGGADRIKPKILSILVNCREYLSKAKSSSSDSACSPVRSFSSFSQDTQSFSEEDWRSLFQHFRRLRVLNLGDQEAQDKIDDSIRDLTHLRYLKVKPAKSIPVPIAAIFNLWNLQTIDLRKASFFDELPVEIWKMQQLRHLYLGGNCMLPEAENEDHLPNLLTLSYISNDPTCHIRVADKAPNLRKLGLHGYRCESKAEQEATFSLQHLQSLKFAEECTFIETIILPETITQITVKAAVLQPNVMEMFGKLPKLRTLKLVETNFENDEWKVLEDSFPRLRVLKIANSDIVSWKLEKRAMPRLRHLVISCCFQLSELPTELHQNSAFQELQLLWPSPKLANKLAEKLEELKIGFELKIYPPIREINRLVLNAGWIDRDLLDIYPTEIKFPFELNKRSSCSIELANNTNQFVAFIIYSTSKKYRVNRMKGIVLPRSTFDVTFTMQAQNEAPINMESEDYISIRSMAVPHGTTDKDIILDMFNREPSKVVKEFKLPVIYLPTNPLQLIREESSSRASVPENGNRSKPLN